MTFSERMGMVKPKAIQVGSLDDDLRNSLWNVFHHGIFSRPNYIYSNYTPDVNEFAQVLWIYVFKKPLSSMPIRGADQFKVIERYYMEAPWNKALDFVEITNDFYKRKHPTIAVDLNSVLERENSGYRLISGQIAPVVDPVEIDEIEAAMADSRFKPVAEHITQALRLLGDRKSPDYRNSIKESISAVESMACILAGKPKASLGDALKELQKAHPLHGALVAGFSSLYGYTSDGDGIRHGLMDEDNLTVADARYFLVSCASFANYLKTLGQ